MAIGSEVNTMYQERGELCELTENKVGGSGSLEILSLQFHLHASKLGAAKNWQSMPIELLDWRARGPKACEFVLRDE